MPSKIDVHDTTFSVASILAILSDVSQGIIDTGRNGSTQHPVCRVARRASP